MVKIVKRPWGLFKQFVLNKKCTVKIIEVDSGEELSLQLHKKRKEMWYFLTNGIVQIGDKRKKVNPKEVVDIDKGKAHRVLAGKNKVIFLEISFGEFSEKDEIRLEDKYNRK
jgi:mannose-6-phosphate isomerase-like protein (cupin superfamily)